MARYHSAWITANYGKACQQPLAKADLAGTPITVHKDLVEVFERLGRIFTRSNYDVHPPYPKGDTGAYSCRQVTGGRSMSPHSWGVAVDVNWKTNPYKRTPDRRKINWQTDTDMTPVMIGQVRNVTLGNRQRVFYWGGDWQTIKDAMHFQIIVTPAEIAKYGIVGPGEKEPPMPEPTWKQPGDPVTTVDDAMAALIYQGGANHWNSLMLGKTDAVLKAGQLADRAMVLQDTVTTIHQLTKDTQ